ncbi:MAG: hypothetical protein ACK2U2_21200 [Anaerolineae bacterium]|jgi:hypothetical protein
MLSLFTERRNPFTTVRWCLLIFVLPLLLVAGCGPGGDGAGETPTAQTEGEIDLLPATFEPVYEPPQMDLTLPEEGVTVEPLPLRAGFPFTVTALVQNNLTIAAEDVPVLILISAEQEEIGYSPYAQLITVTVPASETLQVDVPVEWNFAGGEHRLWIQVNRLPDAWQDRASTWSELDTQDNIALIDLMVDPFDAYTSDLCSGRVDVEIGPEDILPQPDQQRVWVRVRNVGNHAVYNLPVVVTGAAATGIAYTPAIPPCGGTAELYVPVDKPIQEGDALTVQVNPRQWADGLQEDDFDNNQVSLTAGLAPGLVLPPQAGVVDYDFSITTSDIEIPEAWHVLVTVHNLGTRDAAMVPITIENEAGRMLTDAIPLVQGEGSGLAAIRVGYLWIPGGTLTFTVNPEDARGAFPEARRDNNTATFTLP